MKMKLCIALLFLAVSGASVAQTAKVVTSEKPGWHKIGERHVGFKADQDEIIVLGNDHFKQVKLKVKDASISLNSFVIYFSNDAKQVVETNKILNAGEETAPVNIDNTNSIKKIVMNYKTISPTTVDKTTETKVETAAEKEKEKEREKETEKERAEVEVWGLK